MIFTVRAGIYKYFLSQKGLIHIDYTAKFREMHIRSDANYPRNDIGIASMFHDLHSGFIRYVIEAKTWYIKKTHYSRPDMIRKVIWFDKN